MVDHTDIAVSSSVAVMMPRQRQQVQSRSFIQPSSERKGRQSLQALRESLRGTSWSVGDNEHDEQRRRTVAEALSGFGYQVCMTSLIML